jgi:hypothetical protein
VASICFLRVLFSIFKPSPSPPKRLTLSYALHNMGKKSMNRRN